jgi:hypothetical protein
MLISWNGSLSTVCFFLPKIFLYYYITNSTGLVMYSFRLLYKLERVLWCYNGVLYYASLSYYVCWPDVRSYLYVMPYSLTVLWKYSRLNYTWINHDRKSVNLAAPTYIDYVMTWIQNLLNDEATFPTKAG